MGVLEDFDKYDILTLEGEKEWNVFATSYYDDDIISMQDFKELNIYLSLYHPGKCMVIKYLEKGYFIARTEIDDEVGYKIDHINHIKWFTGEKGELPVDNIETKHKAGDKFNDDNHEYTILDIMPDYAQWFDTERKVIEKIPVYLLQINKTKEGQLKYLTYYEPVLELFDKKKLIHW